MKKTLAIVLIMSLLCIMAVGTTLTYFTDTDSDVNTMTVGEVGITQKINGDENGGVSAAMFPVTTTPEGTMNNVVDMAVTVTMDASSQNAYVRTIFAFEMMAIKAADNSVTGWVNPLVENDGVTAVHHVVDNGGNIVFPKVNNEKYVVIYKNSEGYSGDAAGATAAYVVGAYTYGELAAGAATAASLKQVYLDSKVGNEFSNAIGGSYDILVLSQAVQVKGFESVGADAALNTAFGEVTADNAVEWFS